MPGDDGDSSLALSPGERLLKTELEVEAWAIGDVGAKKPEGVKNGNLQRGHCGEGLCEPSA